MSPTLPATARYPWHCPLCGQVVDLFGPRQPKPWAGRLVEVGSVVAHVCPAPVISEKDEGET